MRSLDSFPEIYFCIKPVDFRKGLTSLSVLVEYEFSISPFSNVLFLFINKKKTSIKAVYWDKTGFALWQKILDKEKFSIPINPEQKTFSLTFDEIKWLLSGINPWKVKKHKELSYSILS